ncbi:phosphomethylpyrimidine kinase [Oleiphilus messinensis]|uniref:hydroxymethylpyrimidine kinase n=1 Tax=Oleiphilus messinensis TaxID=141451 RepID=A0A1Y0IEZ8_9GAMM|nr:hydroxymethylpyrimidine/phosphomethylpyrimidine kinase [Oleiphilus messinensis]ARU58729.1 phosphomethylpyrimidine kinase [Oleiphilus messinensis]
MPRYTSPPNVLILSGLDPSGGAGIQADIQTTSLLGCHPLPIVTLNTVQTTARVLQSQAVSAQFIRQQIEALQTDVRINAIKVGALGDSQIIEVVRAAAAQLSVPLIIDPVLRAGGGGKLFNGHRARADYEKLYPLCTLITPNSEELLELTGASTINDAVVSLTASGCEHILVTGGHEPGAELENRLYGQGKLIARWQWTRIEGEFHGTGCTLAAAISAGLAKGYNLIKSCKEAQTFTDKAIRNAYRIGQGQSIPCRIED